MARVVMKVGSEGPMHDPYNFTEITLFRTDGQYATFHVGVVTWVNINGRKLGGDSETVITQFENFSGIEITEAMRLPSKIRKYRMRNLSPEEREELYQLEEDSMRLIHDSV